jgi:ketosteroid isomerase-like protein
MCKSIGVALLCLLLLPLANADTGTRDTATERDVLAAVRARLDALAHHDMTTWASYVADDMLKPMEAELPSKTALLKEYEHWPVAIKYYYGTIENPKVRIHGDTAIVTYRVKQYNDIGSQLTYIQTWQIETHIRRGNKWLLVAVADAPIPMEPAPAKIDPKTYDAYIGEYEYAPDLIAVVTHSGDRLLHKMAGAGEEELLPEDETTFFIKGEAAAGSSSKTIFIRDSSGRVTHYIYRQYGATDRIVRKVK